MDGGITRQSEQYDYFDNTPRPERVAREVVPESVIREYTRGRSIGAGQLNPRQSKKTWCPDCLAIVQDSHKHGEDEDESPKKKGRRTHFAGYEGPAVPESYWHDDEADERRRYNAEELGFDREPPEDPYGGIAPETPLQPLDQMLEHSRRPLPFGPPGITGSRLGFNRRANPLAPIPEEMRERAWFHKWMDEDPKFHEMMDEHAQFHEMMDEHAAAGENFAPIPPFKASRLGFDRQADFDDGDALGANLFGDGGDFDQGYGEPFIPMRFRERAPSVMSEMLGKVAAVPLLPGHRVGLPYKDGVIPGIVTHLLPNAQVGIRWHDGQHSMENPGDVYPL